MIKDVTQEEFSQEAVEGSKQKLTLVYFSAPWCGPCKSFGPLLEKFAAENSDYIRVVKVNIDTAQEIAAEQGVWSIPTLALYEHGEETKRHVGVATKSHMERSFLGKGNSFYSTPDLEDH